MRSMIACALALACALLTFATPARAERVPGVTTWKMGIGPITPCAFADTDGTLVYASAATPCPVADPSGASYVFSPPGGTAEGSSAASYTFSTVNQLKARAWYAACPVGVSAPNLVFTDANGGTMPWPLASGGQSQPDRIVSFTGNNGCYIGYKF